jgi:hypothetical protein
MRSLLGLFALAAACAPTFKSYKPQAMLPDEGAVVGRVKVVYNGSDVTSECGVCFRSVNGPCYKLDASGLVAMTLKAGGCSIRRIACNQDGERHFHFDGGGFEVAPAAKTYFGDVSIEWNNDDHGFKPSILFGLAGAIVDQSINDGVAKMFVDDSRDAILGWYGGLVGHKDRLPLNVSLADPDRPMPPPTKLAPSVCAPLQPAIAAEGAEVHEGPDPASAILARFEVPKAVCAGKSRVGFGFRRIKLPGGVEGFVEDANISL